MSLNKRGGFTLVELLATVAILAIVTAMTAPMATGWWRNQKLQEAIDDLRTDWIKARTHAMDEGRPYRFQIQTGNNGYRIAPNDIGQWADQSSGVNAPPSGDPDEVAGTVIEKTLPENLIFEPAGDLVNLGGNPEATWLFLPDGRAKLLDADGREHQLASILLSEQGGGRKRQLTMRALTAQASLTPLGQQQ
ncbi:MAG: prepilin-type N-terminal cleavage/methylation domain-containing protein [Gemmatales bacterium]